METQKSYRKWGTQDCPISLRFFAGMKTRPYSHWHPEVEILFVEKGQATFLVEEQPISLSAEEVLIIAPEQPHRILVHSPDVLVRYLTFSLDVLELPDYHIFQKEFVKPLRSGELELPQVLRAEHPAHRQIYGILKELHAKPIYSPDYKIKFYAATVSLCAALLPWCKKKEDVLPEIRISNATVYKAIIYLHNHYTEPVTLDKVAKWVHLNPCYLSTLIKQETGMTFLQYLAKIRIEAAEYLLRRDDLSMSEVAEKAGFGSECVFFRRFKAATGMTPKAYRKQADKTP